MDFKLINDVTQPLKKELFGNGWLSLGVVQIPASNVSKERYFFLLMNTQNSKTYIEEYVDFPEYFIKIKDENLWNELYMFFTEHKLISFGINREIKIAKKV